MQRILVLSDSHGINDNVRKAVKKAGRIDTLIHLGDVGANFHEIQTISGVPTYIVCGNTDYYIDLKDYNIIHIGKHKIFATHGHRENVNYSLDTLKYKANLNDCDIAMYGHTHMPYLQEDSGITVLNPGSITMPRQGDRKKSFVVMEILDDDKIKYNFNYI